MMNSEFDVDKLRSDLAAAKTQEDLYNIAVNAPFDQKVAAAFLFLGIMVFLKVNKQDKTIDRIALSDTELAKSTTQVSVVPFEQIKIPLSYDENIIARALEKGEPQDTTDWKFLFAPALSAEQARINQASAGIAYSAVYPLKSGDGGALIFSYFQYRQGINDEQRDFMAEYASAVDKALGQLRP